VDDNAKKNQEAINERKHKAEERARDREAEEQARAREAAERAREADEKARQEREDAARNARELAEARKLHCVDLIMQCRADCINYYSQYYCFMQCRHGDTAGKACFKTP